MAAVVPDSVTKIGTTTILSGGVKKHTRHLQCAFTDVDGTNPDTWDTRQVVASANRANGLNIVALAWEATASADEGAVTVAKTAATATQAAYDTVTFTDTSITDMDGTLHVWAI